MKIKDSKITSLERSIEENSPLIESAKKNQENLREANVKTDYLPRLLNDAPDIELNERSTQKFKTEIVQCVMNLIELKVPVEKVGEVIREVSTLCGKNVDHLPSASTVNRIADSKVALAQKQIGTVQKGKERTTLYTDETCMGRVCKRMW